MTSLDTGPGGVRIYSRAPITQAWLAQYAVPAWEQARDGGRRLAHLRRGWLHGPHVDLVVDGATPERLQQLAQSVDPGPAPAPEDAVTEADYLPMARELGRLESVPPPYLPMRRHGEVQVLTAAEVGTGEPALDELRLVCGSTLGVPLAATLNCIAVNPGNAVRRVAEILTAMVDVHTLGIGYGVFSLHSHAEGFFAWTAPTADVRPAFERRYAGEAEVFRDVVRARISGSTDSVAASWRNALGYCSGVVDGAVSRGTVTGAMLDAVSGSDDVSHLGPPGAAAQGPTGSQPDTDFHRTVHAAGVEASHGGWFTGYRLLVNLVYEQLPVLDVPPMQRYYTCYAVARAVDEELCSTWRDRLGAADQPADEGMVAVRG
ncbi:hypothetical protein [Nocardioides plantarum]|uniref:Lantibiotic biosynthesis dehydratase-like protein n=1 Tax=Nocardioides plantarum TaxID=29299 RepID=A0ABV5K4H6_9ACTN|nr:hypothetical protein [Nocardioides plantarum]